MANIKVLVTGSNGQLGSELRKLTKDLVGFEFLYTDLPELNITNSKELNNYISFHKPNFVINCAAYTAVDKAESEKELAIQINATAVRYLVEACEKAHAYFIHISTDYVFDGTNFMPYKESDVVRPQSVYGHSKLQGEQYALSYNKSMIIRTSWLYSIYGNNFVKTMLRLGKEKAELGVVFDQVGTPTNAADLAACILSIVSKVSNKSLSFVAGKYHYSNEGVCSWYDFAAEIMQIGERTCKVLPIETKDYPTPARRPHYSVLNKSKIKQTYQIEIPHWKESLKTCMNILLY